MGSIPDEPPPGTQQKTLSQDDEKQLENLRQRIVRLRGIIWQLRTRVHEQRDILRAKEESKSAADDRFIRALRLSRCSMNKLQVFSKGRTLQELFQDCEKERDEFGRVEDDYIILESQLDRQEFEIIRLEEHYVRICRLHIPHESQPNFNVLQKIRPSSDVLPDHHLLVIEYLSKLRDIDILRERHEWHQEEREVLETNRETLKRVNRLLSPDDEAWLDQAEELESVIMKNLFEAEVDVEELRKKCEEAELLDENGMPSDFETQELEALVADPELDSKVLKPEPHSKWRCTSSILYRLREYSGSIGFCTLFSHFATANACGMAATNEPGNILQSMLGSEAPAAKLVFTLGAGAVGAIFVQRRWNVDMRLLLNVLLNLGILILAQDPRFSDGELLVLCFYAAGTNLHWMKNKLVRLPKTGGVTALGIVALASYSGWMIAPQFPELEGRFNNHLVPKVIASLPTSAAYSAVWVAVFEQTRLAEAIENGVYDSHIWEFIVTFLKTFLVRFFERAIEVFTERMFGYVEASFENNMVRRSAQDVEAGRSANYPRNEPFRSPGNGNHPRQDNEDGFSDQWSQSRH